MGNKASPFETWPQSLKNAVSLILQNGMPMYLAWGKDFTQFYNDGYAPFLGSTRHPQALGNNAKETWPEIWKNFLKPESERFFSTKSVTRSNLPNKAELRLTCEPETSTD